MAAANERSLGQGPTKFSFPQLVSILVVVAIAALASSVSASVLPVVVAGLVTGLMPSRHDWRVRSALGAMAALLALFVVRNWPVADAPTVAAAVESPTLLSWLIALPMLGGLAILAIPKRSTTTLAAVTMVVMLGTLALALPILRVPMGTGYHFNQEVAWMPQFGIHYHVAIDGVSLWLVMLTVFITPIAAYASFGSVHTRIKEWCIALLLLEAGMLGAFVALDLFLFYIFWELMLIPMYLMIGIWGGADRIRSAVKFFLYTMFGSVLMLGAMLYMVHAYSLVNGGIPSFDYFELQRLQIPMHAQRWLWAAFALAFLIKVPMFPLHTWLPDAHTDAPTAGSIILAAVMLKMGTYGYLRFCLGLFPEASTATGATLAGVAVLGGILYGALCAWKQSDVKRLVAYSSVAHLGYVMLGIFGRSQAALQGSILQMVNHGISTGALFLLVGVLYDRRHTRQVADFGGIAKVMPVYTTLFIIATLASIGLPGTNGFIGEFMIITGTFASPGTLGPLGTVQAVGAAVGVILGALYMLSVVQKVFFGPITKKENRVLTDINSRELLAVAPLIAMTFIIGLFPNIFLQTMTGATKRIDIEASARAVPYAGPLKLVSRMADAPKALSDVAAEATK